MIHLEAVTKVLPMESDSDVNSIHGVPFKQCLICTVQQKNTMYNSFDLYVVKYFTSTIIKPITIFTVNSQFYFLKKLREKMTLYLPYVYHI